jgi:hypothetical protein
MHMFNASTDTPNAGLISLMARVKSSIVILRFAYEEEDRCQWRRIHVNGGGYMSMEEDTCQLP